MSREVDDNPLELADELEKGHSEFLSAAADVLRLQHERIAKLEQALDVALNALDLITPHYRLLLGLHDPNTDTRWTVLAHNAMLKLREVRRD